MLLVNSSFEIATQTNANQRLESYSLSMSVDERQPSNEVVLVADIYGQVRRYRYDPTEITSILVRRMQRGSGSHENENQTRLCRNAASMKGKKSASESNKGIVERYQKPMKVSYRYGTGVQRDSPVE